ncbi:FAD/NAD-P-binding domain-containing protein [Mycena rebaudengoi]|nr:FAD/NAD-P-binding domain-containing protein [Mycena rebaudengoi]
MIIDPNAVASTWLHQFGRFLSSRNVKGATQLFLPAGYLRDVLVFTWNNRTLAGHSKIAGYLADTLKATAISDVKLDTRAKLVPELGNVTPLHSGVSSGFTFNTSVGTGQGYFGLVKDDNGEWKALTVLMTLVDIRGHEEAGAEKGVYGGHTLAWHDIKGERHRKIEEDPHVLIIGAGQTGLNVAAKFRQMNIPSIVIEQNKRVGDNWRQRYATLTLHTTKMHHTMLYQSYPDNWPTYTPRDKLADWLEQYALSQDLVIWTESRALPTPTYDAATRRWTITIERAGKPVMLHPAHIVLAAGTFGKPRAPQIADSQLFRGISMHAAAWQGGDTFAGKRILVVGAGNSAADICQDLAFQGAESVTMLQRSSTCIVAAESVRAVLEAIWPEDVKTDVADFKSKLLPFHLMKEIGRRTEAQAWAREEKTHEGLKEAGFKLNMGSDGSGYFPLLYERFGGFWVDVGCAPLIASGKVKIKQDVEIARFTPDSVVFTDGASLQVDAVIYATSYESIRDTLRQLFGDATIDQTGPLWGVDEEGELKGCYRPSGHPGLWYAAGDFAVSRFYSKQLALEIKALELGLMIL